MQKLKLNVVLILQTRLPFLRLVLNNVNYCGKMFRYRSDDVVQALGI